MSSPVNQHILWSSQLKGMERSVCSFKSFISIVPPNPRPELYKPLPPTPELTPVSPSLPSTVSEQASSVNLWTALKELEWKKCTSSAQRSQSLPLLSNRKYSTAPLNPAPEVDQVQTDSSTRPYKSRMVRPLQLKLDQESLYVKPGLPSRNPARQSRSHTICTCATRDLDMPHVMMDRKRRGTSSSVFQPAVYREVYSDQQSRATVALLLDSDDSASDASTELKSLAWSSIGSPRPTKFDWGEAQNVVTVMEAKVEMRKNQLKYPTELYTSHRRGFILRDGFQERELARKLEQLSLLEGFHEKHTDERHGLDSQSHKGFLAPTADAIKTARSFYPRRPSRDHQFIPLPPTLGRRRSNSSFSCSTSLKLESDAKLSLEIKRRQKARAMKTKTSEMEIDGMRKKESRLPSILGQSRSFTFSKKRPNLEKTRYKRRSSSAPSLSSPPISPFEQPGFLPQIPGGFATVRRSPFDLPQLQTSVAHDDFTWPRTFHEYPPMSPSTDLPGLSSGTFHTQPSLSVRSRTHMKPMVAVRGETYSPISLPPSPYYRLHSPLSPTSPLAHEIPLPPTPIRPPPTSPLVPDSPHIISSRSFNCGNPIFNKQGESTEEHDKRIQNILGRVRSARDTWRRFQQEIRREKLKQSIRVIGPTDLATAVGYAN